MDDFPPETWKFLICKEFKYGYWEYEDLPVDWIEIIKAHWREDASYAAETTPVTTGGELNGSQQSGLRPGRIYNPSQR